MAMRLLIIGGSVFLGRALTEAAVKQGHEITLLNRGRSCAEVPRGVKHLRADRDQDLSLLEGACWDAVIDTCAYFPHQVRRLLSAVADLEHDTFISSVSAYHDLSVSGVAEDAGLSEPRGDEEKEVTKDSYGPLKSGCEQEVRESGVRALIIRPGVIAGPFDPTGRFGYWVRRMASSNRFVAPHDGEAPFQIIDVRDLAVWIINLIESRSTGAFNAVGPGSPLTFRHFIETGVRELGSRAQPIWIPEATLAAQQMVGWGKLPLWLPKTHEEAAGLFEINGQKAWDAGLVHRPLAETIRDVAAYEASLEAPVLIGMTPDEEARVLGC